MPGYYRPGCLSRRNICPQLWRLEVPLMELIVLVLLGPFSLACRHLLISISSHGLPSLLVFVLITSFQNTGLRPTQMTTDFLNHLKCPFSKHSHILWYCECRFQDKKLGWIQSSSDNNVCGCGSLLHHREFLSNLKSLGNTLVSPSQSIMTQMNITH